MLAAWRWSKQIQIYRGFEVVCTSELLQNLNKLEEKINQHNITPTYHAMHLSCFFLWKLCILYLCIDSVFIAIGLCMQWKKSRIF